jgi:hypothetical protein
MNNCNAKWFNDDVTHVLMYAAAVEFIEPSGPALNPSSSTMRTRKKITPGIILAVGRRVSDHLLS